LEPLGIQTLLIEPGRFRTKLLSSGNLKVVPSEIPDYAETSRAFIKQLVEEDQNQPGNAEKGVRVIVDLVRKKAAQRVAMYHLDCHWVQIALILLRKSVKRR